MMKQTIKYTAQVVTVLVCVACLSGCFDRRELDTMGIVMGIAIDKAEAAGETEITVQMAHPAGKTASGSKSDEGDGGSMAFINVSNTGHNINAIVREMQHKMSRLIYVAHNQVIVFGEELAKNGVRDALDFFVRAPEARMTLNIFVAKGKAKDVLDIRPEFEKMTSTELIKILKDQKITSHAPIITEFEFVSTMVSKTTAAVAPIISIKSDGEKERLSVSGSAVFKDSVMIGEFGEDETRGLLFVKNKVKAGVMELRVLDTPATIEIRHSKSRVTPVLYTDGRSVFNVDVEMLIGLGDQSGTVNLAAPENTSAIRSAVETAVKDEIERAVTKSKELNADVFGFGEYLNRKYPDQWNDMQDSWDALYKNITVNATVKVKADGAGRLDKPLVPEGA